MNKHNTLVEALKLWAELTEFDDERKSFTIRQLRTSQMTESIREALELDDTNITGFLMLSFFTDHFIDGVHFSLNEMLENRERVDGFVAKAKQLKTLLKDEDLLQDLAQFQLTTRQAVRHYRADSDKVMEIIADQHDISVLRRDALRSMKELRVDHFTVGEPEPESVKPVYMQDVLQWWSINSMLQSLCHMPSGVSLNLIRTPDDYQSYFVFAVRNGGHLVTISDIDPGIHPLAKYDSRRPDKDLDRRISKNWFPYDLLGVKYDEEQGRLWVEKQDLGNALVPANQKAFSLAKISDLGEREIVWVTLMLELIVERFWRRPVEAPKLSYTGEMVRVADVLIKHASEANLPVTQYQDIEAKALTVEEVAHPDEEMRKAWKYSGGSHNDWLVERYKHRVSPTMLNMINNGNITAYLLEADVDGAQPNVVSTKEYSKTVDTIFTSDEVKYVYHSLEAASFGTKEKLLHDRLFLARANFATEIQRLADAEYRARKGEIRQWYVERIEKNFDMLLSLASHDECWIQRDRNSVPTHLHGSTVQDGDQVRYQLAYIMDYETSVRRTGFYQHDNVISGGFKNASSRRVCILTGASSSHLLHIAPQTVEDLALVTGLRVEELPDVLRHWCIDQDYEGNSLLSRVDPVAWMLNDPWILNGKFAVNIWLSKRGLASVRNSHKKPDIPDLLQATDKR